VPGRLRRDYLDEIDADRELIGLGAGDPGRRPRVWHGGRNRPKGSHSRIAWARDKGKGTTMSDLIAIGYDSAATADEVLARLLDMQKQRIIQLDDAVVVERQGDGKVKLHQTGPGVGTGAASGALWGGLIGLLFFVPLLGMAVGAGTGALAAKASDTGVDDNFMKRLGEQLTPGHAALVLLVRQATPDKVLEQLHGQYGGQLLQTSLSREQEDQLRAAAEQARLAAASQRP
jgi:uncharacterized membrane protein